MGDEGRFAYVRFCKIEYKFFWITTWWFDELVRCLEYLVAFDMENMEDFILNLGRGSMARVCLEGEKILKLKELFKR